MLVSYAASQLILKHSEREYANNIERQSLDHMNSITIVRNKSPFQSSTLSVFYL